MGIGEIEGNRERENGHFSESRITAEKCEASEQVLIVG